MMRTLLAALGIHAVLGAAAAAPIAPTVHMRDTGYVLGDLIEQHVELNLPPSVQLDAAALPQPGRINNWMELREAQRLDDDRLRLRYQVFAAVESAMPLAVPPLKLRLRDARGERVVTIPAQRFHLSPVLPAALDEASRRARPTPMPAPLGTASSARRAAGFALLALLLGLYLAWRHDLLPGLVRNPGPLTRLYRALRRHADTMDQTERLRRIQQAFNACAQETLYESTLPRLFARAPHLLPLRGDIEDFFIHARAQLYGEATPRAAWDAERLLDLSRRARDAERGLAA